VRVDFQFYSRSSNDNVLFLELLKSKYFQFYSRSSEEEIAPLLRQGKAVTFNSIVDHLI